MDSNFLDRWSKRKLEEKESRKALQEAADHGDSTHAFASDALQQAEQAPQGEVQETKGLTTPSDNVPTGNQDLDLPTEADLDAIQTTGNVSAFLKDQVPQALKNRAFKELFKLSAFNHVDMMDVYMDDYNKFTPLSTEMRDKMALAKQLLRSPDELDDDAPREVDSADDGTKDDVIVDQQADPSLSIEGGRHEERQVLLPPSDGNLLSDQTKIPVDRLPKENP